MILILFYIQVPLGANGCAYFPFEDLCDRPLGAADYFGLFSELAPLLFCINYMQFVVYMGITLIIVLENILFPIACFDSFQNYCAEKFHTLALEGVPKFGIHNRTAAYRFVTLIDVRLKLSFKYCNLKIIDLAYSICYLPY